MDLIGGGSVSVFLEHEQAAPSVTKRVTLSVRSLSGSVSAVYVDQSEVPRLVDRLLAVVDQGLVSSDDEVLARRALAEALTKLRGFGYEGDAVEVETKYGFIYQAPEPFVTRVPS